MNEIDAVKVLECMATDMTGALAGLSKKEPLADVLCQRIEAINLAQSALRSEAERSRGCESCDGGFGDNTEEFGKLGYAMCPYCGKRLEVGP